MIEKPLKNKGNIPKYSKPGLRSRIRSRRFWVESESDS